MQNDLDTRNPLNERRRSGIGGGMIAAIIAALIVVGVLFTWGSSSGPRTTSNDISTGTTTGSASTARPTPSATAPAPATPTTR